MLLKWRVFTFRVFGKLLFAQGGGHEHSEDTLTLYTNSLENFSVIHDPVIV